MKLCKECENYNHVDCKSRNKTKGKCDCWCTKKGSGYDLILNKTRVRHG